MKFHNYLLFILLISGLFISSCSGSMLTPSGWPGMITDDENIYIANATEVFAVRISDGNMVWQYPQKPENKRNFYAEPELSDSLLIVGDYLNTLHAIDPTNGNEKWLFADANGRWIGGVLATDDTIYAPCSDHNLYALDNNGNLLWTFKAEEALWAKPVATEDYVIVPSLDHTLYGLDISSGYQAWKVNLGGAPVSSPILDNGNLYIGTLAEEILAISAADGNIQWRYKAEGNIWSTPLLHEEVLYFGDMNGFIYAISSDGNNILWKLEAGNPVISGPALLDDDILFALENGDLLLISKNGERQWTRSLAGSVQTDPIVTEDTVIVSMTSPEKLIVALDKNGNERWSFTPAK